jgi:hypothetical protein
MKNLGIRRLAPQNCSGRIEPDLAAYIRRLFLATILVRWRQASRADLSTTFVMLNSHTLPL